jgi:hypothetical protein
VRIVSLILVLAALSAGACSRAQPEPQAPLTPERFISVMIALQRVDSAGRPAVLARHKTNEKELKAFVRAYGRNPPVLSAIFDTIQMRIDRIDAQKQ